MQAGLLFSLLGGGYMATSIVAPKATETLERQTLALGAGLHVIGLLGMWAAVDRVGSGGSLAWPVVPMLIDGAGMGFVTGPLMTTVLTRVPAQNAGAASGVPLDRPAGGQRRRPRRDRGPLPRRDRRRPLDH